jgi:hypothetical protein
VLGRVKKHTDHHDLWKDRGLYEGREQRFAVQFALAKLMANCVRCAQTGGQEIVVIVRIGVGVRGCTRGFVLSSAREVH